MSEHGPASERESERELPHEEELDIEAPNESAPGHHPAEPEDSPADD